MDVPVEAAVGLGERGGRRRNVCRTTHPPPSSSLADDLWVHWNVHDPLLTDEFPQSPSRLAQWLGALVWLAAAALCVRGTATGSVYAERTRSRHDPVGPA
jgi:hypothetical protein